VAGRAVSYYSNLFNRTASRGGAVPRRTGATVQAEGSRCSFTSPERTILSPRYGLRGGMLQMGWHVLASWRRALPVPYANSPHRALQSSSPPSSLTTITAATVTAITSSLPQAPSSTVMIPPIVGHHTALCCAPDSPSRSELGMRSCPWGRAGRGRDVCASWSWSRSMRDGILNMDGAIAPYQCSACHEFIS
jgi:hypothetical protein